MHRLSRDVRFSYSPFRPEQAPGFNAYASRPSGNGLAIFLDLRIDLVGFIDPTTGFLVDVGIIDEAVRARVVPLFMDGLANALHRRRPVGWPDLAAWLTVGARALADTFGQARLSGLGLKLNPYRTLSLECEESNMIRFSEKFEFAATHKLWSESLTPDQNIRIFGKCANPAGHGHNYLVEVSVNLESIGAFDAAAFEKAVDDRLIRLVDHKNLNVDVPHFAATNPTMENIAVFAWSQLAGHIPGAALHAVSIWESDRTRCTYRGPTQGTDLPDAAVRGI